MSAPEVVLFDVFGTLVDWYSSITEHAARIAARAGIVVDPGRLAVAWRERYGPSMETVRSGRRPWCDLDTLHRESLDDLLVEFGVDLAESDRAELVAGWHRLRPWPDVRPALPLLRERLPIATLSNGHVRLLVDLTRYAGLTFDAVLSAELAGTYKPDPAVYRTAARLLGVPPDRAMLVACHDWDVAGARAAGLRTAYLPRPAEWGPDVPPKPAPSADLTATNLHDLVDLIVRA